MVTSGLKLLGGLACLLLLPRWGLKLLLLLGCAAVSACALFLALLSHLTPDSLPAWPGSLSLAFLLLSHHLALSPLTWPLLVELSPAHHLAWALPLLAASHWATSLAQLMILPSLLTMGSPSLSVLAWLAAAAGAGAYSLTLWLLPDLRGQNLGAMEEHFQQVNSSLKDKIIFNLNFFQAVRGGRLNTWSSSQEL